MSMMATFIQVEPSEVARLHADPSRAEALFADEPAGALSLEKDWHGVHYVLCGKGEPDGTLLGQAVLGGKDIGDDPEGFSGYGQARSIDATTVAAISAALSQPATETAAIGRFDAAAMERLEIYPGWDDDDDEARDDVIDAFRQLRAFYADAAANGRAIITCIL